MERQCFLKILVLELLNAFYEQTLYEMMCHVLIKWAVLSVNVLLPDHTGTQGRMHALLLKQCRHFLSWWSRFFEILEALLVFRIPFCQRLELFGVQVNYLIFLVAYRLQNLFLRDSVQEDPRVSICLAVGILPAWKKKCYGLMWTTQTKH